MHLLNTLHLTVYTFILLKWKAVSSQCENSYAFKLTEMLNIIFEFNATLRKMEDIIKFQVLYQISIVEIRHLISSLTL